jgi:hypothetical protein
MKITPRTLLMTIAIAAEMLSAGCASGPCTDLASIAETLREKMLGCESQAATGPRIYVTEESIAACEPLAEAHCTDADLDAIAGFRSCIEELDDCSGDGAAFMAALEACQKSDSVEVSTNCNRSLSGASPF